jgi:hypothetical protein
MNEFEFQKIHLQKISNSNLSVAFLNLIICSNNFIFHFPLDFVSIMLVVEDTDLEAQEMLKAFYLARKEKQAATIILVSPASQNDSSNVSLSPPVSENIVETQMTPVTPLTPVTLIMKEKIILSDKCKKQFYRELSDYNRIVLDNRIKSAVYATSDLQDIASTLEDHGRTGIKVDANGSFLNSEIR